MNIFNKADQLYLIGLMCFILLVSCHHNNEGLNHSTLANNPELSLNHIPNSCLQDGDIIVRKSLDPISTIFSSFNVQGSPYSHCGLIFYNESLNKFEVFHITASENDSKIKQDKLSDFIHPKITNQFAVFRLQSASLEQTKKVHIVIDSLIRNNVQFDEKFDWNTDDKMYCTELVYKTWVISGIQTNRIRIDTAKKSGKPYLPIENLIDTNICKIIFQNQINSL
jgi:hypothetical protein